MKIESKYISNELNRKLSDRLIRLVIKELFSENRESGCVVLEKDNMRSDYKVIGGAKGGEVWMSIIRGIAT